MGLRVNPSQRQQRIGLELRRLRDISGMTAAQAGQRAGIGGTHLGHMESGRTAVPSAKLHALLDAYGIESEPYIRGLLTMNDATGRGWWSDYRGDVASSAVDLAELEGTSESQGVFDMVNLPGLLQSPEYARALLESAPQGSDPRITERFLEFRLQRQEILTGDYPARYHAIIHEAAFHMGFVDPTAMRRQLAHLVEVARLPHVIIQILPFRSSRFPAMGTPFTLFHAASPELNTVYLEHDAGAVFFGDQGHLNRYNMIFERLSSVALPALMPEAERRFPTERDSFTLLQHLAYIL
ncbi:helix-turn-helix transcriptional regulator [Streptomyces sp. NPDC050610]|uniref:helix-turn-helix domain-containing protein n=1 Tax=Streptomyces sp. NPDC050610 TaxID=3157097 RepID=UPI00343716B7